MVLLPVDEMHNVSLRIITSEKKKKWQKVETLTLENVRRALLQEQKSFPCWHRCSVCILCETISLYTVKVTDPSDLKFVVTNVVSLLDHLTEHNKTQVDKNCLVDKKCLAYKKLQHYKVREAIKTKPWRILRWFVSLTAK